MKKLHPALLSALTGLLLYAAWPESPLTLLIFIAFIPLLWLDRQGVRRARFFGWTYLSMLIWNIGTTWWIWNASIPGALGAILTNSLLMCIPWLGFHLIRSRMGNTFGYSSLILFWLSFEYFHLQNWGLSWPWLTLGNVFSTHPDWISWYQVTGASGGSLWILLVNVLLFQWFWQLTKHHRFRRVAFAVTVALIILPIFLSWITTSISFNLPIARKFQIVIVQPNIDPYEKVETGTFESQLQKLIRLSESAIDTNTALVVWPETALVGENLGIEEDYIKVDHLLRPLWDFLRRHPQLNLFTGLESFRVFDVQHSPTAIRFADANKYYESYNAAAILDTGGLIQSHYKSKLVPGVETLPFFLRFLAPLFDKFGGTTAGYTGQADRNALNTTNSTFKIAPAVCFESIYGEYLSEFSRDGADLIAVITNDGWWGNTPGHLQHRDLARLRAVETGHWVVRSANTGISCVIDPHGRITQSLPWDEAGVIKTSVPPTPDITFYARFGDCLSKLAAALTILLLVWHLSTLIKRRTSRV
jgi:apolipoprotein N-acyltransferase